MQSPLMPKVGKQHIENTEQVSNTCTQCHQRIHIGGTVLCLLPSVYKKNPCLTILQRAWKRATLSGCIGHIHKEHSMITTGNERIIAQMVLFSRFGISFRGWLRAFPAAWFRLQSISRNLLPEPAFCRVEASVILGRYSTVRLPVAKFTEALTTPLVFNNAFGTARTGCTGHAQYRKSTFNRRNSVT